MRAGGPRSRLSMTCFVDTSPTTGTLYRMKRRLFLTLALVFLFTGCLTPKANEKPKSASELRYILQDFHMKLRWGLWEQASAYTAASYKNEFMGRYEELGEDYKITNLNIKQVTLGDPVSLVEVEQEWYVEPDMTLKKERYMESWVTVDGNWRITERIPKKEYREREKEAIDEITKQNESDGAEAEPAAEPEEADEFDTPTDEWQ